ncbi:ATP-dependent helicase HrpB [Sneathiella marina]|uniref:ATP-dependent helicase HrpB n=1 Tax=Sneathiella marina TaxID=2950108 RepID=A0ABY4W507_9PROT|nr:ATP-dependent helicase HrpB [Sneathiella marina]USG62286.1 ATP-dependent helicase HrpB [Sneathiella marina]
MKEIFRNSSLPIVGVLDEISDALSTNNLAILQADPGAGKTTFVPLYLLDKFLKRGKKIVMLEPRRLAARMSAQRMANMIGEEVGETVGYRVRLDSKVSATTRIEVVTEGVLTRRLQADPELSQIDLLIFDEFHERSLQTDLGLALSRQIQEVLRDDLSILIMSATLEAEKLSALLGNAPVISSKGRQFPIQTHFLAKPTKDRVEVKTARAIDMALAEEAGDILVFLPGVGEINRVQSLVKKADKPGDFIVFPLYGNLRQQDQNAVLRPSVDGVRKVVLATDIAETSLTIEGIKIVIDAGLSRSPIFDPNSGMSRLETTRVSRSSADQRRGRAGRLTAGICYRLWTAAEDRSLVEYSPPEILTTDLCTLMLELANWGVQDVGELPWMTPPPIGPMAQAVALLISLGALDKNKNITSLGKQIVRLPLHPRLSTMVIKSAEYSASKLACDIASLLSERDILRRNRDAPSSDIKDRLNLLIGYRRKKSVSGPGVDDMAIRQIDRASKDLMRRLKQQDGKYDINQAGLLLAFAYPDRIGDLRNRSQLNYRLSGGRGARLDANDKLLGEPYLVAADVDGKGSDARIYLAAALSYTDIQKAFEPEFETRRKVYWDEKKQRIEAVSEKCLGALILQSTRLKDASSEEISAALVAVIRSKGLQLLPWDDASRSLVNRVVFARYHEANEQWPDFSNEGLAERLEEWLLPYLVGLMSLSDLQSIDLASILRNELGYDRAAQLDVFAPPTLKVPSGSHIRLDYSNPQIPVLSVRLQEVFGLREVPKIAKGKVAVTIHLLSPAHRPLQVTSDLESFWRTTYNEVKKDMKGRYPKHYWPEDPLQAEATSRAKKRKPD